MELVSNKPDFDTRVTSLFSLLEEVRETKLKMAEKNIKKDPCMIYFRTFKRIYEMADSAGKDKFKKFFNSTFEQNKSEILKNPLDTQWLIKEQNRPKIQVEDEEKIKILLGDFFLDAEEVSRKVNEELTKKQAKEDEWKNEKKIVWPQTLLVRIYNVFIESLPESEAESKKALKDAVEKIKTPEKNQNETYNISSMFSEIISTASSNLNAGAPKDLNINISDKQIKDMISNITSLPMFGQLFSQAKQEIEKNPTAFEKIKDVTTTQGIVQGFSEVALSLQKSGLAEQVQNNLPEIEKQMKDVFGKQPPNGNIKEQ